MAGRRCQPKESLKDRLERLQQTIPLQKVENRKLQLLKALGYDCPSKRAIGEAAVATIVQGKINQERLKYTTNKRLRKQVTVAYHLEIAVKVIDYKLVNPAFIKKELFDDLKYAMRLKPSVNIAGLYGFHRCDKENVCFVVSELPPGVDVITYMASREYDPDAACHIFTQVTDAFAYAHEEGVIHRDLTPASIIVDKHGHVKVRDFALSPKLSFLTKDLMYESTKRVYTAPEVIRSRKYESHKSDMYSIGIILYEMLTGDVPYTGIKSKILQQINSRSVTFPDHIDIEIKLMVKMLIHPDPQKRPSPGDCTTMVSASLTQLSKDQALLRAALMHNWMAADGMLNHTAPNMSESELMQSTKPGHCTTANMYNGLVADALPGCSSDTKATNKLTAHESILERVAEIGCLDMNTKSPDKATGESQAKTSHSDMSSESLCLYGYPSSESLVGSDVENDRSYGAYKRRMEVALNGLTKTPNEDDDDDCKTDELPRPCEPPLDNCKTPDDREPLESPFELPVDINKLVVRVPSAEIELESADFSSGVETPQLVERSPTPEVQTPQLVEPSKTPEVETPQIVESSQTPEVESPQLIESSPNSSASSPQLVEPSTTPVSSNASTGEEEEITDNASSESELWNERLNTAPGKMETAGWMTPGNERHLIPVETQSLLNHLEDLVPIMHLFHMKKELLKAGGGHVSPQDSEISSHRSTPTEVTKLLTEEKRVNVANAEALKQMKKGEMGNCVPHEDNGSSIQADSREPSENSFNAVNGSETDESPSKMIMLGKRKPAAEGGITIEQVKLLPSEDSATKVANYLAQISKVEKFLPISYARPEQKYNLTRPTVDRLVVHGSKPNSPVSRTASCSPTVQSPDSRVSPARLVSSLNHICPVQGKSMTLVTKSFDHRLPSNTDSNTACSRETPSTKLSKDLVGKDSKACLPANSSSSGSRRNKAKDLVATSRPGTANRSGTASRPGTANRSGTASRPGTANRLGTASRSGTGCCPGTASLTGTASYSGTTSRTGTASHTGTVKYQGDVNQPSLHSCSGPTSRSATPSLPGIDSHSVSVSRPVTSSRIGTAKSVSPTSRQGTISCPGTASRPGTNLRPGTTSRPGTNLRPGTTSRPGTNTRQGTNSRCTAQKTEISANVLPMVDNKPGTTRSNPGVQTVRSGDRIELPPINATHIEPAVKRKSKKKSVDVPKPKTSKESKYSHRNFWLP